MELAQDVVFELDRRQLRILNPSTGGVLLGVDYSRDDRLLELVQGLVYDLVVEHQLTAFGSVCGRCGSSCRRPEILVREQEIIRLRQRLGLSEQQFQERYLAPAQTWNAGDAVLAHKDGACPFLQAGAEPEPNSATCTVYEDRPISCRMFTSTTPACRKNPVMLIEELVLVKLAPENCVVVLKSGLCQTVASHWWERLRSELAPLELSTVDRRMALLDELELALKDFKDGYHPSRLEHFRKNLERLRRLLNGASRLADLNQKVASRLEGFWAELSHLETLLEGPEAGVEAVEEPAGAGAAGAVVEMVLTERGVAMRCRVPEVLREAGHPQEEIMAPLPFTEFPALKERVQAVMYRFLTREDEALQLRLTQHDPPCFMCGECCRLYAVEIMPSDILRLCQLLEITPGEFVERYTEPPRFNWNRGNRILKKAARERGRPLIKALPVSGQHFSEDVAVKECVFLERREDGFYYCGVHSHKPDVCRAYEPNTTLCRRTNQLTNWGRQAQQLAWVKLTAHEVMAQTLEGGDQPPLRFARDRWAEVDAAVAELEAEIQRIVEADARRWLEERGLPLPS